MLLLIWAALRVGIDLPELIRLKQDILNDNSINRIKVSGLICLN